MRRCVGRHHGHSAALRQLVDHRAGRVAGRRDPFALGVHGPHRGARVDDEHDVRGQCRRSQAERPGRSDDDGQCDEELQQQEPAEAEPLPRGVGLDVVDQLLPQERGADRDVATPQPQHVEGDDHRQADQAQQRERRDHSTTLRRRRTSKSRSARSRFEGTGTYAPPRRAAKSVSSACQPARRSW